jgi:hypothetical protein
VPERYNSIGEAVGAAMAHNIRLVHGEPSRPGAAPVPDPHSVTGMTDRLTETATPEEVAAVLAEITTPVTGPLAQLTELIAAAADWASLRVTFDEPHRKVSSETWSKLTACYEDLRRTEQWLYEVQESIPTIPGDLRDPRLDGAFRTLRTQATHDDAPGEPPAAQQHAARTTSPHTAAGPEVPPSAQPAAPPSPSSPAPSRHTR